MKLLSWLFLDLRVVLCLGLGGWCGLLATAWLGLGGGPEGLYGC